MRVEAETEGETVAGNIGDRYKNSWLIGSSFFDVQARARRSLQEVREAMSRRSSLGRDSIVASERLSPIGLVARSECYCRFWWEVLE